MKELASAEQLASVLDHIVDNAATYGAVDKDPYMRKIAVLGEVRVPCPTPPCTPNPRARPVAR